MAADSRIQTLIRQDPFPCQVNVHVTYQQRERLDTLAAARQLSVSAIVREAIRAYLAGLPEALALAQ